MRIGESKCPVVVLSVGAEKHGEDSAKQWREKPQRVSGQHEIHATDSVCALVCPRLIIQVPIGGQHAKF